MRKKIFFLRAAESDAQEIETYIMNDNPPAAQRFRVSFQETTELLLRMPLIGSMRVSIKPALQNVRVVPVKDFERYFIFYHPIDDGIEIVRVLHAARNYPSLF